MPKWTFPKVSLTKPNRPNNVFDKGDVTIRVDHSQIVMLSNQQMCGQFLYKVKLSLVRFNEFENAVK